MFLFSASHHQEGIRFTVPLCQQFLLDRVELFLKCTRLSLQTRVTNIKCNDVTCVYTLKFNISFCIWASWAACEETNATKLFRLTTFSILVLIV